MNAGFIITGIVVVAVFVGYLYLRWKSSQNYY